MAVILVDLVVALIAGVLIWVVVRRWPRADPAAPPGRVVAEEIEHRPGLARALARRTDPVTATGLVLTVAVLVLAITAVVFGVLMPLARADDMTPFDLGPAEWAAEHATDVSTAYLRTITWLGGTAVVVPLAILVGVLEYRRRPAAALPLFLVLVVGGQSLIVNSIKWTVDRVRPDIDPLAGFAGTSFPSGHSAAAAACYAGFALLIGRLRPLETKAVLSGLAAAIAASVAASRVLLGVHWFSDVLAGLAVGWAWFALCSIAFGGRLLRFGAPVEAGIRAAAAEQGAMDDGQPDGTEHDAGGDIGRVVKAPVQPSEADQRHDDGGEDHQQPAGQRRP
jgi:membrane-associated phospholipid phosphatase